MGTSTLRPRMRVVSLACSNTEIVCALGGADLLVGVDDHSDFPEEVVARLPRVGPDLEIDVERVAALSPDLVLATLTVPGHEKVVERLEAAGLPYLAPEPVSLADVYRNVQDIAGALGIPERGAAVVEEMQRTILPRQPSPGTRTPTLAVEWWPNPVILPGKRSWTTDLIALAGGEGLLAQENCKSRPLTDDEVRDLAPDAFVLSWCGVDPAKYRTEVIYDNPAWQGLPALRRRRVYTIPEAHLGRPSPRLVDGYRALTKIVDDLVADHRRR